VVEGRLHLIGSEDTRPRINQPIPVPMSCASLEDLSTAAAHPAAHPERGSLGAFGAPHLSKTGTCSQWGGMVVGRGIVVWSQSLRPAPKRRLLSASAADLYASGERTEFCVRICVYGSTDVGYVERLGD
jgi:hypothetical protein